MAQKTERKALLLKTEVTYGTDAVPTGGANAILARNLSFDPNPATVLSRDLVKPTLGRPRLPIAARHVTLGFDVEMAGGGAAGTAPKYGPALRACGLAETINVGVDVQYDPVSASEESCSIYFNMDGTRHAMVGVRGDVSVVYQPNDVPLFRFALTGLHVNPAAQALPVPDFSSFQHPLPMSVTNTPTFTLHTFAAVLRELTLAMGQRVVYRDLVNAEAVDITGREPSGSCVIESPALGTKDFFAIERAETQAALQLVHGTVAGNIVQADAPKIQILNPRYRDVDGNNYLEMDLSVGEDTGDDELKITVK